MNIVWIMQKDVRYTAAVTAGFTILLFVLPMLSKVLSPVAVFGAAVALSGVYMITALFSVERHEERNNGYPFLLRMPILPVEVAAGKLLLMYLHNVLSTGLLFALIRLSHVDPGSVPVFRSIALAAGCVWLILVIVSFYGICMLGYSKFFVVFRVGVLVLLVAIQAVGVFVLRLDGDLPARMQQVGASIAGIRWLVVCLVVSMMYFCLIAVSGRFVKSHTAR